MSGLNDALPARELARRLGSIKTAKKAASSKRNAKLASAARKLARTQRTEAHRCHNCGGMPWIGRSVAIIAGRSYCERCLRATGIEVEKENRWILTR